MQNNDIDGSGGAASGGVTAPQTVADVLDAAADLLEKPGAWSGPNGPKGAGCHCTALGIDHVVGRVSHPDGIRARRFFADFIGVKSSMPETLGIYHWNDAPGRTQSEVVAALRAAATSARQGESHAD